MMDLKELPGDAVGLITLVLKIKPVSVGVEYPVRCWPPMSQASLLTCCDIAFHESLKPTDKDLLLYF